MAQPPASPGATRPRECWVKRDSRCARGYYGGHVRLQNMIGVVNPKVGQLVSLIVLGCDTEIFRSVINFELQRTHDLLANGPDGGKRSKHSFRLTSNGHA